MKAHDFNLPDQNGISHQLKDYAGQWLVLYFYPKDFTSGWTAQACNYRDFIAEIRAKGAEVVGVAKRTTFLIDPAGEIVKTYENVDPSKDARNILEDLASVSG